MIAERYRGESVLGDGVATDSTGTKLSYTAPTSRRARVRAVSWFNVTGAPTVQLRITRGGATITVEEFTASSLDAVSGTQLEPDDTISFVITAAALAGSTADIAIHVEEEFSG